MAEHITQAVVLAAGKGERMRPLTDHTPKPLLPVLGITPLARCINALVQADITTIIVNYHHLGAQISNAVGMLAKDYPNVTFHLQDETAQLLDTGGTMRRALPLLGQAPFFTVNAADFWEDGDSPALQRMQNTWDAEKMDALLLLHAAANIRGDMQNGNFVFDPLSLSDHATRADDDNSISGPIQFKLASVQQAYMFGSVTLIKPELFAAYPLNHIFSQRLIWEELAARQRLYGLLHDNLWYHLTSPADYTALNPA